MTKYTISGLVANAVATGYAGTPCAAKPKTASKPKATGANKVQRRNAQRLAQLARRLAQLDTRITRLPKMPEPEPEPVDPRPLTTWAGTRGQHLL